MSESERCAQCGDEATEWGRGVPLCIDCADGLGEDEVWWE